ncbi:DHA2 family efflux MFS transporter permease subunit, partial [Desulfurella sp.]|uniref:DHA2 family efflux MFS transporter permease subunit n=1 Tax=Desulfurella sp. TaxID=1962857 RepID=UPI0025C3463A
KNFYMFGIALFTLGSALCGLSWNLYSIVIFRILEGIGGGILVPMAQATLREVFPKEEQGAALGIFGMAMVTGPAFGPMLAGWIVTNYNWRWIFYINLPFGIIALIMVSIFIKDPPFFERKKEKIDFLGLIFMAIGLGTMQIFLANGENKNWFNSNYIIDLFIIATIGIILFIIRELTTDKPVVNLRVIKNKSFSMGALLAGLLGVGMYATIFIVPIFLEKLLGYTAFDAGFAMLPRGLGLILMTPVSGKLFNKLGPKILVGFGLILVIISLLIFATLNLNVSFWYICIPQFLQGAGFGFIFVALNTSVLLTIDKKDLTAVTGMYYTFRLIMGSIGIALVATLADHGTNMYYSSLTPYVSIFNRGTLEYIAKLEKHFSMPFTTAINSKLKEIINAVVIKQAQMLSYNHVFFYLMLLFIACLPLIIFLKGLKDLEKNK